MVLLNRLLPLSHDVIEVIVGRKHDRTAVVIQPKATEQKPTPVATMNFNSVMDQRGCVYVWKT